ncbi:MAG: hypothetical protein ACMZI0_16420 [Symbiopectobacterium sp.]|uniref:hypothetical protein n=1 Tax=Symbiopectobacterium sp. TaxID=2952789 RepID=UPI0039EC5723
MLSCALLAYQLVPLHSSYLLLLIGLARTPETGIRRSSAWASLRPSIAVPPQVSV